MKRYNLQMYIANRDGQLEFLAREPGRAREPRRQQLVRRHAGAGFVGGFVSLVHTARTRVTGTMYAKLVCHQAQG